MSDKIETVSEVIEIDSFSTSLEGENINCTLLALVETKIRAPPPEGPEDAKIEELVDRLEETVSMSESYKKNPANFDTPPPFAGGWMGRIKYDRVTPEAERRKYHKADIAQSNAVRQLSFSEEGESFEQDANCLLPMWNRWAPQKLWQRYQKRRKLRRRMRPLVLPENPTSAQKLYHEVYEEDRIIRLLKDVSPHTYNKLMKIPLYYNFENPESEDDDDSSDDDTSDDDSSSSSSSSSSDSGW